MAKKQTINYFKAVGNFAEITKYSKYFNLPCSSPRVCP